MALLKKKKEFKNSTNSDTKKVDVNKNIEEKKEVKEEVYHKFIITIDNLRVRISPDLNAEKIENLPANTEVLFLNEKSNQKTTVTIQNKEINEYWYKIKTPSGNIGWIHGCCFENK